MAPLQVSWFVRMCVIVIEMQCVMQFVRQKLGNTHNSVNFYSNWKIDPSKPKISASLVQWSGSEITKKYTFWTEKWKNWASENGFLSLLDFENSLFWYRACEMCHRKVYFTCKVGGCNSSSSISNMKMLNILWKFLSKILEINEKWVTKFFENVVHIKTLSPCLWGDGQVTDITCKGFWRYSI